MKLDTKSLKCVFFDYSSLILYLLMLYSLSLILFSLSPPFYENQGEKNNLLLYSVKQTSVSTSTSYKLPISVTVHPVIHVYYKRLETLDLGHAPTASSSEDPATISTPAFNLDLPITICKGKCTFTYPISSSCLKIICPPHLVVLSLLWNLLLFLKLLRKPYPISVGLLQCKREW